MRRGHVDAAGEGASAPEEQRAEVAFGPTAGVRLRPRLGLQHHGFEGMGAGDRLQVWLGFDPTRAEARAAISAWAAAVPGAHVERPFVGEASAWLDLRGLPALRQDVSTLIEAALAAGLPLREAAFTRLRQEGGAWRACPDPFGPATDPELSSVEDRFRALWSPAATPPPREHTGPPAVAWLDDGSSAVEAPSALPAWPDARIGYGLAPARSVPTDARTREVRDRLDRALSSGLADAWTPPGWPSLRPKLLSSRGEPDAIDKIEWQGRVGYLFGVYAGDVELLLAPGRARWRDAELLEATLAAVRELGLDRTIAWERRTEPSADGRPTPTAFVFQLWERAPEGWAFGA